MLNGQRICSVSPVTANPKSLRGGCYEAQLQVYSVRSMLWF